MNLRIVLTLIMMLFFVSIGTKTLPGQISDSAKQRIQKQSNRRINIYYHPGSIELPEGCRAYYREAFTDAWRDWIESADGKFKINRAAGLVDSSFEKYKKDFKWTKTENTAQNTIKLGLMRDKKSDRIVAGTGWIQFTRTKSQPRAILLRLAFLVSKVF